jgi:hypothetical protein
MRIFAATDGRLWLSGKFPEHARRWEFFLATMVCGPRTTRGQLAGTKEFYPKTRIQAHSMKFTPAKPAVR